MRRCAGVYSCVDGECEHDSVWWLLVVVLDGHVCRLSDVLRSKVFYFGHEYLEDLHELFNTIMS